MISPSADASRKRRLQERRSRLTPSTRSTFRETIAKPTENRLLLSFLRVRRYASVHLLSAHLHCRLTQLFSPRIINLCLRSQLSLARTQPRTHALESPHHHAKLQLLMLLLASPLGLLAATQTCNEQGLAAWSSTRGI